MVIDVSGFSCFGLVTGRKSSALRSLLVIFYEPSQRSLFVLMLPRNICLTQVHDLHSPSSHPTSTLTLTPTPAPTPTLSPTLTLTPTPTSGSNADVNSRKLEEQRNLDVYWFSVM